MILFLKLKGEIEICNVALTSVENFEICELKPTNNQSKKNIHSLIARVNSVLHISKETT